MDDGNDKTQPPVIKAPAIAHSEVRVIPWEESPVPQGLEASRARPEDGSLPVGLSMDYLFEDLPRAVSERLQFGRSNAWPGHLMIESFGTPFRRSHRDAAHGDSAERRSLLAGPEELASGFRLWFDDREGVDVARTDRGLLLQPFTRQEPRRESSRERKERLGADMEPVFGAEMESWMVQLAREVASRGDVHHHAAAIGLVLRLNPRSLRDGLEHAARWVHGLDACDRTEWQVQLAAAILDWDALVTELDHTAGDAPPSVEDVRTLLELRDDLESSAWLRRASGLLDDDEEALLDAVNRDARATLAPVLARSDRKALGSPRWDRLNDVSVSGLKWWVPSSEG